MEELCEEVQNSQFCLLFLCALAFAPGVGSAIYLVSFLVNFITELMLLCEISLHSVRNTTVRSISCS